MYPWIRVHGPNDSNYTSAVRCTRFAPGGRSIGAPRKSRKAARLPERYTESFRLDRSMAVLNVLSQSTLLKTDEFGLPALQFHCQRQLWAIWISMKVISQGPKYQKCFLKPIEPDNVDL